MKTLWLVETREPLCRWGFYEVYRANREAMREAKWLAKRGYKVRITKLIEASSPQVVKP